MQKFQNHQIEMFTSDGCNKSSYLDVYIFCVGNQFHDTKGSRYLNSESCFALMRIKI